MSEKTWLSLRDLLHELASSSLMPPKPPVLPPCPPHKRLVEVAQNRIHRRRAESPVVLQPSPQNGVIQPGDVLQAQVGPIAEASPPRLLPHSLEGPRANRGREAHKHTVSLAILHGSRPKGVPENVKLLVRVVALPTSALAVNNPRLIDAVPGRTLRALPQAPP